MRSTSTASEMTGRSANSGRSRTWLRSSANWERQSCPGQADVRPQTADAKEELLLTLTSKNTTRSIKDFAPEGIRLESNLEGEAKGVYNATFYATITMLVKPDRTIDYEERQIHTTSPREPVPLS